MKKITLGLLAVCMLMTINPLVSSTVAITPISTNTGTPAPSPESQVLINRLAEIKATDRSNLSPKERKALRMEKRAIKKELRANRGVYLSVGAIIIIVLLLILIL